VLILLLFTVPGLSTLAKDSWYLPASNPVHYLNIANKMHMPHCPVIVHQALLQTVAKIIPLQPVARSTRVDEPDAPKSSIGLTLSLQHRSPPPVSL
jgi:hypothetical protein